jgi:hypothetical protein
VLPLEPNCLFYFSVLIVFEACNYSDGVDERGSNPDWRKVVFQPGFVRSKAAGACSRLIPIMAEVKNDGAMSPVLSASSFVMGRKSLTL